MFTVERYHDISCGHRVVGHENKCRFLHGHNYRITFVCASKLSTLSVSERIHPLGQLDKVGRVLDFGVIKERMCQWLEDNWDHKMLLWSQDPIFDGIVQLEEEWGIVYVPFNPTAENMAHYLVTCVGPHLLGDTQVRVMACRVEETRKCSAVFNVGSGEL